MDFQESLILSEKTIKAVLSIFRPRKKRFEKGELILEKGTMDDRLFLMLKGTSYLCVENEYNTKQLISFFMKGQFICHEMLPTPHNGHCFVQAKYPTTVAVLSYTELMAYSLQNPTDTRSHSFSHIFRNVIAAQSEHCHILQQKTIRSKLLAFLQYQSLCQNTRRVQVPIPYSDLADYLTIDRSALMTELRKMQTEGIIEKDGHTISF
jgi:CRP/FNR family transcriptional regulator, anaerobic regulatory protein